MAVFFEDSPGGILHGLGAAFGGFPTEGGVGALEIFKDDIPEGFDGLGLGIAGDGIGDLLNAYLAIEALLAAFDQGFGFLVRGRAFFAVV